MQPGNMTMELLDQLEKQVHNLLAKLASQGDSQEELAELRARCQKLEAENKSITDTLELERRSNKAVLQRVDTLLAKLKSARESDNE